MLSSPTKEKMTSSSEYVDRKSALVGFATLLGTFSLERCSFSSIIPSTSSSFEKEVSSTEKENNDSSSNSNQQQHTVNQTLCLLLSQSSLLESSFPSLSLDSATRHHNHHHHHEHEHESKAKVEALASYNLARPIIVSSSFSSSSNKNSAAPQFYSTDVASVPIKMLQNFKSSLALLVDARLRAFGTILARHARVQDPASSCGSGSGSGGATERKLCALLRVGASLSMDSAVTSFAFNASSDNGASREKQQQEQQQQEENEDIVSVPLTFEAVVDVGVPNLISFSSSEKKQKKLNEKDALTINIKCPAIITGHFFSKNNNQKQQQLLQAVRIKFDTHVLLSSMIAQASLVVMKVVENVNAACSFEPTPILQHQQQQQLSKNDVDADKVPQDSSSTKDKTKQDDNHHHHQPKNARRQASPTIVSPDFGAMASCLHDDLHFAPHLDLTSANNLQEATYDDEEDDGLVSVENWAALIDDVIGNVDDELLYSPPPPPRKKVKFTLGIV